MEGGEAGRPFLFGDLKRMTESGPLSLALTRLIRSSEPHSAIVTALATRSSVARPGEAFDHLIRQVGEEYGRNLAQMGILARGYDARMLIATQPYVESKTPLSPEEGRLLSPEDGAFLRKGYLALVRAAREAAERSGAEYWDATSVFDGAPGPAFKDPVHFSSRRGNQIVAERLAEEIIRKRLLEAPPEDDAEPGEPVLNLDPPQKATSLVGKRVLAFQTVVRLGPLRR
jgi:hypothetical protein